MRVTIFLLSTSLFLLFNCQHQPDPIHYGLDQCEYCKMTIVEELYGGVRLTDKGKRFTFDSVECLAADYLDLAVAERSQHSYYLADFEHPGELIPLDSAIFVHAVRLPSPMGLNLSAHSDARVADHVAEMYFGSSLSWGAVVLLVKEEWKK